MPAFLIPILISAGLGLVSGATSAYQTSRNNQRQASANQQHQQQLLDMIDRMFAQDTTSAPINAANRAISGQFAGSGLGGSGMNMQAAAESAAGIMAQDLARKQQTEAQVLQNPVFGQHADPSAFNPWADAFAGGAMGAFGGAAQAYGAQMSTEAGAQAFQTGWDDWSASRAAAAAGPRASIPTPAAMVPGAGPASASPLTYDMNWMGTQPSIMKQPRRYP